MIIKHATTIPERLDCFWRFVEERDRIRVKKESGMPRPWTGDNILDTYHFCNVRRADDRVTKWIGEWASEWPKRDRWFAFVVARWINEPDTLVQLPQIWSAAIYGRILEKMHRNGQTIFRGSYIITGAFADKGQRKYEAVIKKVLNPIWKKPPRINESSIEDSWMNLRAYMGMGSFMAGQVVADWQTFGIIDGDDVFSWAPLGPGSGRGLKWIFQNERKPSQTEAVEKFISCRSHLIKRDTKWRVLTLHDVQNCLCEFSKYVRGYSKTKYEPFQPTLP